ncbi:MAG TPA: sulfatase [Phycisphaerae bacterium]|nr:sulfatase [Phycisphaerae bacterium]HOQ84395.1 sulfatase [Phycisphaerae bacterium]HPZ96618.1 sulfatase [Phycisphaerae bacterium]HQE28759.1 sulfatase [Phycisphaerae bacterium]
MSTKSLPKLTVLFCSSMILAESPATGDRPHIVLFIADDYSWHDCGAYGSTDVRTPHLDRLARESMRFEYAFAASPTCAPSRSAIYTGLYPFRNGAHANHSLIHDGVRTWPQHLQALGYRVVIAGKTHIGPRDSFPFEYLAGSNVMPPGKRHVLWTDLHTEAVDRLLAEHDRSRPLCLLVCSHSPHVYWPENDGYDPARVILPPYLVDTTETRASRCRYYTDVSWMDAQVGEVRASLIRHGYAERTLFVYTADQGAQWPFAKWNLYDAGIRVPLVVHWPGRVRPGSTSRALISLIDLLPTMIEAAGSRPPEDIDGRSFLDVLTGKSERHRDAVFAAHTGDKDMNRSPMRCVRDERYKYILNLAPEIEYATHISQSEDRDNYWTSWLRLAETDPAAARLVERYERRPAEELYDVMADPFELKNLADDPRHADVLKRMREQLKAWRIQQGEDLDKVPLPEDARTGQLRYAG